MAAWVVGVTKAAASRIGAHLVSSGRAKSRALITRGRETAADLAAVSGWVDDGMLSYSEAASLMQLLGRGLETDECD